MKVVHENIEWSDIWVRDAQETKLSRALLIGDSIARGYYPMVEEKLKGRVSCAKFTTSQALPNRWFLKGLSLFLRQFRFSVIHFNNGLHGWEYTEAEYDAAFPALLELLASHRSKPRLVWAASTPMRDTKDLARFGPRNERVIERNRLAAVRMSATGIPVNDLYTPAAAAPAMYAPDGVHFNDAGRAIQGELVADWIGRLL